MRKERWAPDAPTAGSLSTSNPRDGSENGHYVHHLVGNIFLQTSGIVAITMCYEVVGPTTLTRVLLAVVLITKIVQEIRTGESILGSPVSRMMVGSGWYPTLGVREGVEGACRL